MEVRLYNFGKRVLSTARPPGQGTLLSCRLKEGSSIINPYLDFSIDVKNFNYMYIPSFKRYYFISDIRFNKGIWEVSSEPDALASARDFIGNSNIYYSRCSTDYNTYIPDDAYSMTKFYRQRQTSIGILTYLGTTDLGRGTYIIGVITNNDARDFLTVTGMTYYIMDEPSYRRFSTVLLSTNTWQDFFGEGFEGSINYAKSLVDPGIYVKSAIYLPIDFSIVLQQLRAEGTLVPATNVLLGGGLTIPLRGSQGDNQTAYRITNHSQATLDFSSIIPIDMLNHPQSDRGLWLNKAPYTDAVIYGYGLFNDINIPVDYIEQTDRLVFRQRIDITSGLGTVMLNIEEGVITKTLDQQTAQIGYKVPLTIVRQPGSATVPNRQNINNANAASSFVSGVAGAIANPMNAFGNLASAFTNQYTTSEQNIADAKSSMQSVGTSLAPADGGLIKYRTNPVLNVVHHFIEDEDRANRGRPLCRYGTANALKGNANTVYLVAHNPIEFSDFTMKERSMLRQIMQGGFYYE